MLMFVSNHLNSRFFTGLRDGMRSLYAAQRDRAIHPVRHTSFARETSWSRGPAPANPSNGPRPQRRASYERVRPPQRSPTSPRSPTFGAGPDSPPPVSQTPESPPTSTSTGTSRSTNSDVIKNHWAQAALKAAHTSTPLPSTTEK